MAKGYDLTGQRFGRLLVISSAPSFTEKAGNVRRQWNVECDCGITVVRNQQSLYRSGDKGCCKTCMHKKTNLNLKLNWKNNGN